MMRNFKVLNILLLLLLLTTFLACGPTTSTPQQAPVASSGSDLPKHSVQSIYDDALKTSSEIVQSKMNTKAWMKGIAWALVILTVIVAIAGVNKVGCLTGPFVGVIVMIIAFRSVSTKIPQVVYDVGHLQANVAINDGVDQARKEQASNFQYIAATINGYGMEVMHCTDPVNYYADCSAATSYYTNKDVNCHMVCADRDDDGDCTRWTEECDTKHVSWFPYLVRHWVSVATKGKYIFDGVYDFRCLNPETMALETCSRGDDGQINDSRNPAIFVHADWRVPVGVPIREEVKTWLGTYNYNDHVPQLFRDVQQVHEAANSGGQPATITGYFVGKYFHWGFGSNSPQFRTYDGPYRQLMNLTEFPGPNGVWFNYKDGTGRDVSMNTLLFSGDGDLATKINPVFFFGFDMVNPSVVDSMSQKAREFQGEFGPGKESINYVVVVNDEIVRQMGGIIETTSGLMGWLQDEGRWGLNRTPKNQTMVVVSASADLATFSALNFETGMPFGNVLVRQRIRMLVTNPTPFTWDNLMGNTASRYLPAETVAQTQGTNWGQKLSYKFADMRYAGGITSLLYENQLPEYADKFPQPDPNSDECTSARPEHVGYIRPQMCTQQYLETTIKINDNGRTMILTQVTAGSNAAVNNTGVMLFLFVAIVLVIATIGFRSGALEVR